MYNDEIIHYIGGINEYIGKLDQEEHPSGKQWRRLNDPCRYFLQVDKSGMAKEFMGRIQRDDKAYLPFVDLYCPNDSLVEIRVLDKNGTLFKTYHKELKRQGYDRIVPPSQADIANVKKVGN